MTAARPLTPPVISATGAHLPTLEAVRLIVQERVDAAEAELAHKASVGIQSPHGEGYTYAMRHVLDLLEVMAQ